MRGQRTVTEYRVRSTRDGTVSDKRYGSLKSVRDRIGRLTHPEPWRFWGSESDRQRGPDEYVCCGGTRYDECNCGGKTLRQDTDDKRAELPPVDSIEVSKRTVTRTAWENMDAPALEPGTARAQKGSEA